MLLPILSELTSSKNNENVITPVTVSKLPQTPLDELILPPVLVPQLQMATNKPSPRVDVPLQLDSSLKFSSKEIKSRPLSLEMFNHAASDLDTKGIINLKNYNQYLIKKSSKPI